MPPPPPGRFGLSGSRSLSALMAAESMSRLQIPALVGRGTVFYFVVFKSDNPAPRPKLWVCLRFDHQNGELIKQDNSDYFLLTISVPLRYKAFGSRKPVHTYICLHMHPPTGLLLCWVQRPTLELCAICICVSELDEKFFSETTELLPIIVNHSLYFTILEAFSLQPYCGYFTPLHLLQYE